MHTNSLSTPNRRTAPAEPARFDAFGLRPPLLEAVRLAGYDTPTPIQRIAIPHIMRGRDLTGCAQTGTGKTAAFALPILHHLLDTNRQRTPEVLVLAPTRELAAQIGASFGTYAARTNLRHIVVFGGVKKGPQIQALRRLPAILVATPGRLLDLMSDDSVSLRQVRHVVLDEGDRMLDMGFIPDVRRIMRAVPRERQTLLFSATMPREVQELAARFQRHPERVTVDPILSTRGPIEQSVYFVDKQRNVSALVNLLRDCGNDQALVFTRTKHGANKVVRKLDQAGLSAAAIHGNKSQSARERALAAFKAGSTRIVVATDLASRGLDIKGLPRVINFDLPNEPESYVHRIGRTGRAGLTGIAVSLCSPEERPYLASIERLTQRRLDRGGKADSAPPPAPPQTTRAGNGSGASYRAHKPARTRVAVQATPARRQRSRHRSAG